MWFAKLSRVSAKSQVVLSYALSQKHSSACKAKDIRATAEAQESCAVLRSQRSFRIGYGQRPAAVDVELINCSRCTLRDYANDRHGRDVVGETTRTLSQEP